MASERSRYLSRLDPRTVEAMGARDLIRTAGTTVDVLPTAAAFPQTGRIRDAPLPAAEVSFARRVLLR